MSSSSDNRILIIDTIIDEIIDSISFASETIEGLEARISPNAEMVMNVNTNLLYVPMFAHPYNLSINDVVAVVSPINKSIIDKIEIGKGCWNTSIDPVNNFVYALNVTSHNISIIDTNPYNYIGEVNEDFNKVIYTISAPTPTGQPFGIAIDTINNRIYISIDEDLYSVIYIYDRKNYQLIGQIDHSILGIEIEWIYRMKLNANADKLYIVTTYSQLAMIKINIDDSQNPSLDEYEYKIILDAEPPEWEAESYDLIIDEKNNILYCGDPWDNIIRIVDDTTDEVIDEFTTLQSILYTLVHRPHKIR
jgi:hypothetical protein